MYGFADTKHPICQRDQFLFHTTPLGISGETSFGVRFFWFFWFLVDWFLVALGDGRQGHDCCGPARKNRPRPLQQTVHSLDVIRHVEFLCLGEMNLESAVIVPMQDSHPGPGLERKDKGLRCMSITTSPYLGTGTYRENMVLR